MLKKTLFALLLVPAFLGSQVQANYYDNCNSCNDCCDSCFDDWSIYADYLYWRARRCELDYAVNYSADAFIGGSVYAVEPSYDSGVRVGLRKECGKTFFDVHYTYFNNCESSSVESADLTLAGTRYVDEFGGTEPGSIALAKARWDLDYNVVDINGGYYLNDCNRCFSSYFFGGLKLAFVDQELKTKYSDTVDFSGVHNNIKQKIEMDAYGVNLGLGADYNFCGCWNFFGNFSYDVLLGNYKRTFDYQYFTGGSTLEAAGADLTDECWRMVGVANLAFGIGYDYTFDCGCWCGDFTFAIGYEFHQWLNQPDFLDLQGESSEVTFDRHLQSFGLDGLFVRVGLGF